MVASKEYVEFRGWNWVGRNLLHLEVCTLVLDLHPDIDVTTLKWLTSAATSNLVLVVIASFIFKRQEMMGVSAKEHVRYTKNDAANVKA